MEVDQKVVRQNSLSSQEKEMLSRIAGTIRQLAIDATCKANSGHPGMPMGCAELGAYLYGYALRHNPKNPNWLGRDRLILSAGHGSMWLYACLHLSGFNLSLEDITNFRQLHSKTPGHPEKLDTEGVETTTGPLGQGFGNAVGTALGFKILQEKFYSEEFDLFNNKIYCLAGDGCMMEGISSEVSSLAGHLKLDNLIVIYDANRISLDGPLEDSMSEDTKARYLSYGWDVEEIDGHDLQAIHRCIQHVRLHQEKPTLIIARTIIGKGAPTSAGTHKVHGSPLKSEEAKAAKEALGLSAEPFYVPSVLREYFAEKLQKDALLEQQWHQQLNQWGERFPEKIVQFDRMSMPSFSAELEEKIVALEIKSPIAGRTASQAVINLLADVLPQLYGGSADLSCSDMTMISKHAVIKPGSFHGRNIKFGVREFGMAAMATGLSQTGMILPFVGTFLTFSDYMRNAIRLAALQKQQVIYQFTHDSIFLGEDGPTHQPVEHLCALRAIPNLQVIRPADAWEVKMAWIAALRYEGPTAIILSRQNLPAIDATQIPYHKGLGRGAYIVKKEENKADYTLIATGSELSLALDTAAALKRHGKDVRVVSMPCWELFEEQTPKYKQQILGGDIGTRVSIEAGISQGWHRYIGMDGIAISIETFGLSAPYRQLQEEFGFTVESILEEIL